MSQGAHSLASGNEWISDNHYYYKQEGIVLIIG